ncbi:MAG: hypothetical protein AB9922_08255 [Bacteroidales bacterium]
MKGLFLVITFLLITGLSEIYAQNAVCVYCGVQLPNGVHKSGCPYYKNPVSTGNTKGSGSVLNSSTQILNVINLLISLDKMSKAEADAKRKAIEIEVAERKRIKDSIDEINHKKIISSLKRLDDGTKPQMKPLNFIPKVKISEIHFNCKIISYFGVVEIKRNGRIIAYSKDIGEFDLQEGDVISTGTTGIMKLHYSLESGGKDFIMGGNTEVKIVKNKFGAFIPYLIKGRTFTAGENIFESAQNYGNSYLSAFKNRFQVQIPNAVTCPRGTIYTLDQSDSLGCEINVFDGSVVVFPDSGIDSVIVESGRSLIVSPKGELSIISPYNLARLEYWKKEISQLKL